MLFRVIPLRAPLCTRSITHYEVLGVQRSAAKSDIKKAYLEKAKECHPDRNPESETAAIEFQKVQEAHDVLMSSKRRAQYNHTVLQESYYGSSQQTHGHPRTRRARVRTHGTGSGHSGGIKNEDYHEKHRVNNDNYVNPAAERQYWNPDSAELDFAMFRAGSPIMLLGSAVFGVLVCGVVYLMSRVKEETLEGRHQKIKSFQVQLFKRSAERKIDESSNNFWSKFRFAGPAGSLTQDRDRYVWSEEHEKLVPVHTIIAANRVNLKKKFDSAIQNSLGEINIEDPIPEKTSIIPEMEKNPVTQVELNLLRIDMSKKKSEFLAAKREYNDALQEFTKEQEIKKKNRKAQEVV